MITILIDHNMEGQAALLWSEMVEAGWLELFAFQMRSFTDVGLSTESTDQVVWRFVQSRGMILLTDNRRMKEVDSLEQTIREENTDFSLPVVTVGNVQRLVEKTYRERCADRLVEILLDLDNCRGVGRLFIP